MPKRELINNEETYTTGQLKLIKNKSYCEGLCTGLTIGIVLTLVTTIMFIIILIKK